MKPSEIKQAANTEIKISSLPEDLQQLLTDILFDNATAYARLSVHTFTIKLIELSRFPAEIPLDDCRGKRHAQEMINCDLPPIILCGNQLLDGRHRIWAARREGKKTIQAIDLREIGFQRSLSPVCTLRKSQPKSRREETQHETQ